MWVSWIPLLLLILFNLSIGLLVIPDYGVSWDETADAAYGADALRAYEDPGFDWTSYPKRKYYGPTHFMSQNLAVPAVTKLMPEWDQPEVRRFVNLLMFQVAILAMFILCRQFVGYWAALAVTLLFSFQPLLVGHAFINGKDTPFIAMFLLAMALGFAAWRNIPLAQTQSNSDPDAASPDLGSTLKKELRVTSRGWKIALAVSLVLFFVVAAEFLLFNAVIQPQMLRVVTQAYDQTAPSLVNQLFDRVAEDRHVAPVEAYLEIASKLLNRVRYPIIILSAIPLALIASWSLPHSRNTLWQVVKDDLRTLKEAPFRELTSFRHVSLLVASGMAAGLATSVRIGGLLAVFLVGILYLSKLRSRAIPSLLLYGLVTMIVGFITWPYLWSDPVSHFLESYRFMVGDINKDYILFMGEVMKARLLPWYYLPYLMLAQLSEPLWLLVIGAILLLILGRLKLGRSPVTIVVLLLWLLIPTVPLILRNAWFYDNFRQFIFVTPVFFLIAAFALDYGFQRLRTPLLRIGIIALLLLPGIIQVVQLHPYQYVYYNSLVGGVRGAVREYEMDYWATSYAEAMKYLNGVLPEGTTVAFWGTTSAALPHARSDLVIKKFNSEEQVYEISADVIVMITRANIDYGVLPSIPAMAEIKVDDALLAIIKVVPPPPE
jgi:hypothetical protein